MTEIPIWFASGLESHAHRNFPYFFEDLKYFEGKTIKILHLGAYTGHGTKWMLDRVDGSCVDVDLWTTDSTAQSDYEVETFYNKIDFNEVEAMYDSVTAGLNTTKYKGRTEEFFKQNKESFDFIYVDACHDKESAAYDLNESFKILNIDGVIACDDYLWLMDLDPSLRPFEAINEFIEENKEKIEILINNYQLWFKKL
jgi:predicted O-methyltransferase YrrM